MTPTLPLPRSCATATATRRSPSWCLVLAFVTLPALPAFASSPTDMAAQAEAAFMEGVAHRNDSVKARPAFARAAANYDSLWNEGFHSPDLAINRAHAHRLAGDLPGAIAAIHDGLVVARYSRALQQELADARAAVQYPHEGELTEQTRPRPLRGISTRMSPTEAWLIAGVLWLLVCANIARFAMTRNVFWLAYAGLMVAALLALAGLWLQDACIRARDESLPLLVVTKDTLLRKGNAGAYPPRFDTALPKGVEVRELSRRGGWMQVRLPGNAVGWLPEASVLACGSH